jgi:hypothetical protein
VEQVRLATVRLSRWLSRVPLAAYLLIVIALALFRSGIWFTPVPIEVIEENLRSFPQPFPWSESTSYGLRSLLWIFGVGTAEGSMQLTAIATASCIAVCILAVGMRFRGTALRLMLMVVILGPMTTVMLGNIGRNDMLLLTGSVIVACAVPGRQWPWLTVIGAALMVSGNPEQAVAASGALLVASLTSGLARYRKPAVVALGVCTAGFLLLQLRSASAGTDSRLGIFTDNLKASLKLFLSDAPLVTYSGYAALWLLVGYCMVNSSTKDRWLLALAFIAVPLLLTAMTLDQTRVWVGVSSLAILALAGSVARKDGEGNPSTGSELLVGATFLAFIFMPAIEVTFEGIVRMPLEWVYALGVSLMALR